MSIIQSERLHHVTVEAKLRQDLLHLAQEEEEARASFDSTVAQQASEAEAYSGLSQSQKQQQSVLSTVLDQLRQRRSTAIVSGTAAGAANVTRDSSTSKLDSIIGIFLSMLDTVTGSMTKEDASHVEQDAALVKLEASHVASIEHLQTQELTRQQELSAATLAAENAQEELTLHKSLADGERSAVTSLATLCGPSGGTVAQIQALGEHHLSGIQTEVEQVLVILQSLQAAAAAVTGNTSAVAAVGLLQLRAAVVERHQPANPEAEVFRLAREVAARHPSPPSKSAPASRSRLAAPPSRAAQWLMAAAAKHFGREAASAEAAAPAVASAGTMLPSSGASGDGAEAAAIATLLRGAGAAGAVNVATNASIVEVASIKECSLTKQQLMADLVTTRRQLREDRAKIALAQGREQGLAAVASVAQEAQSTLAAAQSSLASAVAPLAGVMGSYGTSLAGVLTQLSAVEADVAANAASAPELAAAQVALGAAKRSLVALQDEMLSAAGGLVSSFGDLTLAYQARAGQLSSKVSEVTSLRVSHNTTLAGAEADELRHRNLEAGFLADRASLEARCSGSR